MGSCFCNRFYNIDKPITRTEHAFSGSLCRTSEFKTSDGLRYCLIIFSLSNYKHLHFQHFDYKWLINKLYALQSMQSIQPTTYAYNSDVIIKQRPFIDDIKIKFGTHSLTIGPVTAFGLVKTAPFADVDVFSVNRNYFTCDPEWDICTCKRCPIFKRLIEFEQTALTEFPHRRLENVILFQY